MLGGVTDDQVLHAGLLDRPLACTAGGCLGGSKLVRVAATCSISTGSISKLWDVLTSSVGLQSVMPERNEAATASFVL